MKQNKGVFLSLFWLVIGLTLFTLGLLEIVDEFWCGMGTGLSVVGLMKLMRYCRLRKDPEYMEKYQVEANDERNQFLRGKAWCLTGYLLVLILGVSVIALKLLGQELLSLAASFVVCLILVLYWISFLILRRKY